MPANVAFPGQSWVIMQYFVWVKYTDLQSCSPLQGNGDREKRTLKQAVFRASVKQAHSANLKHSFLHRPD